MELPALADDLRAAALRLSDWVARQRAIRAGIRELRAMSDDQLDDLGITRDQIRAYAAGRLSRGHGVPPRPRVVVSNPAPRCQPA